MLEISKALISIKHIQVLDVSSNNLSYLGWNALADVVLMSKYLRELDLSGNCVHNSNYETDAACSTQPSDRESPYHQSLVGNTAEGSSLQYPLFPQQLTPSPDVTPTDIRLFASSLAVSPTLTHLACSSCGLNASQVTLICTAACVSANLRILGEEGTCFQRVMDHICIQMCLETKSWTLPALLKNVMLLESTLVYLNPRLLKRRTH